MPIWLIVLILFSATAVIPWASALSKAPAARRLSDGLNRVARRLTFAAFSVSAVCGLLIVLAQVVTLVCRNIFAINPIWIQESTSYFFGAMFLLSGGALYLLDAHVRVDVLYEGWSKARQRLVELVGIHLFILPICAVIIIASWPYVVASWAIREGSSEPSGIDFVYGLKTMIPGFALFLGLGAIARTHDLLHGTQSGATDAEATS